MFRRRAMHQIVVVTVGLIVAGGLGARPASAVDLSEELLASRFHFVAFSVEKHRNFRWQLYKWRGPIVAGFGDATHEIIADHAALLEDHLQLLAEVSGHPIQQGAPRSSGLTMTVNFVPRTTFRDRVSRGFAELDCVAILDTEDTVIHRATILIHRDVSAKRARQCIISETTQALGLMGDVDMTVPTAFSDTLLPTDSLPWYDRVLVRLLYDRNLVAGMSPPQVWPIVRSRLADVIASEKARSSTPALATQKFQRRPVY